jgi:hypothetical protein
MSLGANIRAGGAFVVLYTENNLLLKGLNQAGSAINKFGSLVTNMGLRLASFGAIMTAPLIAAAKDFMDTGSALYLMSQRTGIAVEPLSQLAYAANQAGVQTNDLEIFLRRMSHTIQQAADGVGLGAANLQTFGVSLHDIKNMAPDQILLKIADGFNKIENPISRMARLKELGGRGGPLIAPFLMRGSEGIKDLMGSEGGQAALRTLEQVKAAMALRQDFGDAKVAVQGFVFTIGEALAPTFSMAFKAMMEYVAGARVWIKENSSLIKVALAAGVALGGIGAALLGIGLSLKLATIAFIPFQAVLALLGGIFSLFSAMPLVAFLGLIVGVIGALNNWKEITDGLKKSFAGLGKTFTETWGGINEALKNNDWLAAAEIAILGLRIAWQKFFDWFKTTWAAQRMDELLTGAQVSAAFLAGGPQAVRDYIAEQRERNRTPQERERARLEADRERITNEIQRQANPQFGVLRGLIDTLTSRINANPRLTAEQQRNFLVDTVARDNARRDLEAIEAQDNTRLRLLNDPRIVDLNRRISMTREAGAPQSEMQRLQEEMRSLLEMQRNNTELREIEEMANRVRGISPTIGDIDMSRQKTDVAGTFNAAALFGLGASSIAQQQLDVQQEISRDVGRLADNWGVQTV